MFFLSAGTYSHHAVSPIAEGVEFSPFFRRPSRKNDDILGIFLVRKITFFRPGQSCCSEKFQKKCFFLGNLLEYICSIFLLRGHVFSLCFLGCPRLPEDCAKKRAFFVSGKMTFFRASKNAVFSGHGSRMTVRKNPGYLRWLAGWLTRWAGWLFGNWLRGWLAGWLFGY